MERLSQSSNLEEREVQNKAGMSPCLDSSNGGELGMVISGPLFQGFGIWYSERREPLLFQSQSLAVI